jgi:ABC-type uncharacterized transport system permease subunit
MKLKWFDRLQPFLAVFLGLVLGLGVTTLAGESPLRVAEVLLKSAFGSRYDFGMTLFFATPLVFTGLSVSVAFRAGLFNIGAEGQLALGALAVAALGMKFPHWSPGLAIPAGIAVSLLAGALWGAIPGWLRARRGSHEVINTIMLNFVAAGFTSWATLYPLRSLETQSPETAPVGAGFLLGRLSAFGDAPVSSAIFLALLAAFAVWFLFEKTVLGYEIRAVGESEASARLAGVDPGRARIIAMALAGLLAGAVGVAEVMGNSGKFKPGFSPDYGFIGIAVALLARNHPIGILGSALLFGALHKGAGDLDLETEHVTREVSFILQALVILVVVAEGFWSHWRRRVEAKVKTGGSHA